MTNAARIRQDSLTHFQVQNIVKSTEPSTTTLSPVLCATAIRRQSLTGAAKVSKEQGKRILEEASRKRSESFPEGIAAALQNLKLEQRQDVNRVVQPSLQTDTVIAANKEQSISEPAPGVAASSLLSKSVLTPEKKKGGSRAQHRLQSETGSSVPITLQPALTVSDSYLPEMSRPVSLLIASLGNPPPYHSTRHSAAHIVLQHLRSSLNLQPFAHKSNAYGGGHVSVGSGVVKPEYTLYQSPSLMNISGPPLLKAWKYHTGQTDIAGCVPALVVLHDELDLEAGKLRVRRGNGSARGHNGLKSVQSSFGGGGILEQLGDRYVKIGVGIGRPPGGSKASGDVSAYVLGQLTAREKEVLENATGELEGLLWQEMMKIGNS